MSSSVRDKIIIILAHQLCSPEYLHRSFQHHYHKDSIYKALRSLKEENLVGRIDPQNKKSLGLTPQGQALVEKRIPLYNPENKNWDGYWRLFLFDVPEDKRHRRDFLRKKLKELGFGLWQRSVWISPFSIENKLSLIFKERPHYSLHVEVLKAKRVWEGDDKILANQVWQTGRLNDRYKSLYQEWHNAFAQFEEDFSGLKKLAAVLQHRYTDLALKDPGLPVALLPPDWYRERVLELLGEWRTILET